MKRRSALKTISLGFGYTITAAGLGTLAISCKTDSVGEAVKAWAPSFLSEADTGLLEDILDAMLPESDSSPGYKSVKGIQLVDGILSKVYKLKDQNNFRVGFSQITEMITAGGDSGITSFMSKYMSKQKPERMKQVMELTSKEDEMLGPEQLKEKQFHNTIGAIRNLGLESYFASETIATEHLSYDPIPGPYQGCIPVSDVGNSWSLS